MKTRIANTRCSKTTDHTLSNRASGQMGLDTTDRHVWNPPAAFTRASNILTCQISGLFWVSASIHFPNVPNTWEWLGVGLRINGAQDGWIVGAHGNDTTLTRVNGNAFYELQRGDTVDVIRYQAQNPGAALSGACSFTWVDITRLDRI